MTRQITAAWKTNGIRAPRVFLKRKKKLADLRDKSLSQPENFPSLKYSAKGSEKITLCIITSFHMVSFKGTKIMWENSKKPS